MATKNYNTRTASLRATIADVRVLDAKKMNLDGKNILDYISDSEFDSYDTRNPQLKNDELDIWNTAISLSDNGHIEVKPKEHTTETISSTQSTTIKSAVKVIDNEVLGADDAHLMYWQTDGLTNGFGMFTYSSLTSFSSDLSSLTNGTRMFYFAPLESFNGDLSSLVYGSWMFYYSNLESFSCDLSSLVNGSYMFRQTSLESFNSDLSSLVDGTQMFFNTSSLKSFNGNLSRLVRGESMFYNTSIASFNGDLSSLTNGEHMFYYSNLESFSGDSSGSPVNLSSLTNGNSMFSGTKLTSFNSDLSSLTNGNNMFMNCTSLASFSGDLSSLTNGNNMFYGSKLDAPSLANIVHTINTPTTNKSILIGLGIDDTDEARQSLAEAIWCKDWNEVNQEFINKNWTVQWQFNGAPTSAATLDMNTTPSPIWAKLEEVVADENGKLPRYSYVSEDGSKYFNLYWYHSSNGNNEDYDYFGSLLEACGYYGIVPKEYSEQN